MYRRSRLQQVLDVLDAISHGPIQPTLLVRRTGLPWYVVKEILNGLMHVECVTTERVGKRRAYKLTKKGRYAYARLHEVTLELSPVLEGNRKGIEKDTTAAR